MYSFLFYDLNFFMILLLTLFLILTYNRKESQDLKGKLFRLLVIGTTIMLAFEILSWLFDGKAGNTYYILNFTINSLYTFSGTIVASICLSYADYILYEDREKLKRRMYYMQPTIILFFLVIINIFTPILFKIDEFNVYSRLPLISVIFIMIVIMYLLVFLKAYNSKNKLNQKLIKGF